MMSGSNQVWLQVEAADDEDAGELAELTLRLRAELLDLDVASVDPAPDDEDARPVTTGPVTKGLITAAGKLLVWLGPAGLGTVLAKVADWAARNGRPVELTVDGKSIKLGRASREEQSRLVEAFLAQLDPSP
jgi:hypothetical protein